MRRREALGVLAAPALGRAVAAARPNIVLLIADDHGLRYSGCYGNRAIRTPHIDRLAAEGLRATAAFTGTAMCAPSRSMMFTGLYPHRNGAHPNHSAIRGGIRTLPSYLGALGYQVALAGKRHIAPAAAFPFEYLPLSGVAPFLAQAKSPFCLVVATNDPHTPWKQLPPGKGYSPDDVWLPPSLVDTPETHRAVASYYDAVGSLDRQVGAVSAALDRHGLRENTLFIYTSDHGAELPFSKWTLYDAGLNVPFLARWPGCIRPGSVTGAMFGFVDVLPTLIDIAGGRAPETLDGRSFRGVLEGQAAEHCDTVFGTHTNDGIISGGTYSIRAARTRTHKYIRNLDPDRAFTNVTTSGGWKGIQDDPPEYWKSWLRADPGRARLYQHRPAEELYDIRSDPHELRNLAATPAGRALLPELRGRLAAWMRQQGDPLAGALEKEAL